MDFNHRSHHQHDTSSTTFVEADPSNFRAIVQRLTGPDTPPTCQNRSRLPPPPTRLHQRRQAMRNIDQLANSCVGHHAPTLLLSPVSPLDARTANNNNHAVASTSSSLGSPSTTSLEYDQQQERAAIAEKGFYLLNHHPTTRPEPRLLPLFPTRSPDDCS